MKSFDVRDEKTSLTAAIRHLAEQERRTPAEHATPGELAAYHEGTLVPEIEARVREHLAHCRTCSDLLLDLAGFADLAPPPGIPELTDAEVERDWQALRARLEEVEQGKQKNEEKAKPPGEVVPIRRPSTPAPIKPDREFSPWQVVAAAALVATVGLSAWVAVLKRDEGSVAKPKGGQMVVFDDGGQVRGADQGRLPGMSSSQPATFMFHSPDSYSTYQGEIVSSGAMVWQTEFDANETSPQAESDLKQISFWVPEGALKSGRYEARLYGAGGNGRELIGRLDFEVDAP
jgi:hypothetical protein